ncbi:MAG: segregation/condensation protein A [Anaerolineae bacterium]|nr:segregation/condensation protein A [Anaerolineae bacterium]
MNEQVLVVETTPNPTFEIHTPIFEGPLALLLHLIEKNELDITKVALAQVTDEFMSYVEAMRDNVNIAVIAEFLSVAAQLILIKSKALLPKPPESARIQPDDQDIGDELIRQLRAYRQYKQAAAWLLERDRYDLRAYIHVGPPPRPQRVSIDLGSVTCEMLCEAAQSLLFPEDGPRPEEAIQRPRISITQQIGVIRQNLMRLARVTFNRLLSRKPTRVEAAVTLQAILELIKQRTIQAQQQEPFGDITISAIGPPEEISTTSGTPE